MISSVPEQQCALTREQADSVLPDVNDLLKWIESQPAPSDVPREDIEALTKVVLATKPSKLRENMSALRKVLEHPQAEIRESVLLAMSRSGVIRIAPLLIDALQAMDVHVMLKLNTLCEWCLASRVVSVFRRELLAHA